MSQSEIPDRTLSILLFVDGAVAIFLAVFAQRIGLDPSPGWGLLRYLLLASGIIAVSISLYLAGDKADRFAFPEGVKIAFIFAHLWVVVFTVYAWFITYGNFTTWQNSTRYYAHLADAFSKGQLHVDIKPNTEFLEARDPYDSEDRPHFDNEIWDMSLYKGKLYIYWGPVPALLLTPFQARSGRLLPDIYLVYAFLCGLFIINSLFILKLWKQFFPDVPLQHVLASMFLVAFILPIPWSLNVPEVYEAAIGAGQFFLMGGIYFSFLAMNSDAKRYLFLAGFFWACSVGSRAVNVFSVAYLFVLMVIWIFKKRSGSMVHWKKSVLSIVLLITPLALGAVLIGLYNWDRFDSPFEFGLRYQITIYNLNRDAHLTFQPGYFPFNFYAYVLQPLDVVSRFPFIQPVKFSALLADLKIVPPGLYAGGPMAGILFSTPFLLLSLIPFCSKQKTVTRPEIGATRQIKRYLFFLLGGSLLINAMVILFYFYGQMRFLVDIVSQISLLAVIGYWELARENIKLPSKRTQRYVQLANVLLIITLVFSFLLSFSSEANRMEKSNPALMERINSLFVIEPE